MGYKVEWDDKDGNPQYAIFDTEKEAVEFNEVVEKAHKYAEIHPCHYWEDRRRENIEWRIKHARETADKARKRGDMETVHQLAGYVRKLETELILG